MPKVLDAATASRLKAYFAKLPPASRKRMKEMRAAIRAAAPGAVEVVSYGIPAFKLDGRMLVWYAAWKEHTSVYPMVGVTVKLPASALKGYAISKGTIRFPLDRKLPVGLVKKIVKARIGVPSRGKRAAAWR